MVVVSGIEGVVWWLLGIEVDSLVDEKVNIEVLLMVLCVGCDGDCEAVDFFADILGEFHRALATEAAEESQGLIMRSTTRRRTIATMAQTLLMGSSGSLRNRGFLVEQVSKNNSLTGTITILFSARLQRSTGSGARRSL